VFVDIGLCAEIDGESTKDRTIRLMYIYCKVCDDID